MANLLETGLNWLQVVALPGLGVFIWHLYATHEKQTTRFEKRFEKQEEKMAFQEAKQDDCEQRSIKMLEDHHKTKLELTEVKVKMETMSSFDEIKTHIVDSIKEVINNATCPLKGDCSNGKENPNV